MAGRGAQEALFEAERTWGVGELAARITKAVSAAFPAEVWVRGEIHGHKRPNQSGHVYFDLCERNSRRGPVSTMAVSLYRAARRDVERELRAWPDVRLADGLEVRIRGRVQYSYGRLQFVMTAVDPVHTLGRLAADRERVLRALADEGLLDANRRRPVPLLPLTVGLATSAGSAAAEDVLAELRASGFGFRVLLADARVQGTGAEVSLLAALHALGRARPDVVLLVRGGGARTDLAAFDGERLARAVAAMAVPVFTGVGHEIDSSVADEVAHSSFKTPTACAGGVVERVRLGLERAERAWAGVARLGVAAPAAAAESVEARAAQLASAVGGALDAASLRLDRRAAAVPVRAGAGLARSGARLDVAHARLRRVGPAALGRAEAALAVASARVAGADPARVLARGFTLTRTGDGRLVRRAADLATGAPLVTTFADGTATSTVTAVTAEAPPPEPEPA